MGLAASRRAGHDLLRTMATHTFCTDLPDAAIDVAERHLGDVLTHAFEHTSAQRAVVVWDGESDLAKALTEAYRRNLRHAVFVEFYATLPEDVHAAFAPLEAGDLVVLVQSTSFRLDAFRIRLELFRRGLKVIEHPHLGRMPGDEGLIYIDSLAYDKAYVRGTGRALKERFDRGTSGVLDSGGAQLFFPAAFEPAKLNVGDYREMKNAGGQFPIGEVFTESKELTAVHGELRIFAFGDTSYHVNRPAEPITLVIEGGQVVGTRNSTPVFESVLADIRAVEGVVWVRELGLGLNRAFTEERVVTDIGTYERMCGVHLSLGAKHVSYNKPEIRKKAARFHVDVFATTEFLAVDGEELYREGTWLVGHPEA
jgi:hypothetical protein